LVLRSSWSVIRARIQLIAAQPMGCCSMNGRITLDNWPYGENPPQVISTGEDTPFATFMRSRNPTFKPHKTLGQAKSALTMDTWGPDNIFAGENALYQWDGINNQWILRAYLRKGSKRADYTLWSNPEAFLQGVSNVIDEEPAFPGPPWPCCAGPNSCLHTLEESAQ
jgi:hypothetical protein